MSENNSSNKDDPQLPSMTGLLAFEAAARHLSFATAANELGRTPSAVSHAVRELETRLGVILFERSKRTIALTVSGSEFFEAVCKSLSTLRIAARRLRSNGEESVVRISALPFFTSAVLLPNLSRFETSNPGFELRIETSSTYADVLNGDVDIAIRYGTQQSADLFCEPLLQTTGQPIASPEYLAKNPDLKCAEDLNRHTLIHVRQNENAWHEWAVSHGLTSLQPAKSLSFDSILGAIDAVEAGMGVALGMSPLIHAHKGFGTSIVDVLKPGANIGEAYNFVCRRPNCDDLKIRRTLKWLRTAIGLLDEINMR